MGSLLELSDKLLRGEVAIEDHHPLSFVGGAEEVAPRTLFVASFGNACAFDTDEGLLLVDTGSPFTGRQIFDAIRSWSTARVATIVYTHGHIDHVMGAALYDQDARTRGEDPPLVVAHRAVVDRFDRYRMTAGYNAVINARQFGMANLEWPTDYRYPDRTYDGIETLRLGAEDFELHHGRGETDDHTWVWAPERRVLACGDFFIWASPNAGNPAKAQRYPRDWAVALHQMAELGAEVMLPGHGLPIVGSERIHTVLTDTAQLLESVVDQTIAGMNEGAGIEDIIESMSWPEDLLSRPYLRPIYDEPEFVVRNIWRLYGGWYGGEPEYLKPAPRSALATELASLSGGAERLAERAAQLADEGDFRLACHLAELAAVAAPGNESIAATRSDVYTRRAAQESSTMARGIFSAAGDR